MEEADFQAVNTIMSWLAPGGQLLVSTPFGRAAITDKHRIYDQARLARLFAGFTWVEEAYFQRVENAWRPATAAALATVDSPDLPTNGVALLHLRLDAHDG